MKWPLKRLDQLGSVGRGRSRHRPRDASHLYGGPFPFIQTGDVKHSNLFITEYTQTYSEAGLAQSRIWPVGTLCITIAANIADTSILGIEACFPDSVIGFIPDEEEADVRFIKYSFDALLQRQYQNFSKGAAQDNLSQEKLLSIDIPVPAVEMQTRIADVLASYDALIENNRRRVALLEQAARLLYEEWFVRFRFPGHEHAKFINGLPEGWKPKRFTEVIEVAPKTPIEKGRTSTYVPMSSLSTSGMTADSTDFEERAKPTNVHFMNGDTLLAGITPCLENGKTAFVNFLEDGEVASGSTEFIVLRGKQVSPFFTYCLARSENLRGCAIVSMIGASGRQRVQESCFNEYPVPLAPESILRSFDDFAEPAFQQIQKLTLANQKLAASRDLLLPRLMSGEVEV